MAKWVRTRVTVENKGQARSNGTRPRGKVNPGKSKYPKTLLAKRDFAGPEKKNGWSRKKKKLGGRSGIKIRIKGNIREKISIKTKHVFQRGTAAEKGGTRHISLKEKGGGGQVLTVRGGERGPPDRGFCAGQRDVGKKGEEKWVI